MKPEELKQLNLKLTEDIRDVISCVEQGQHLWPDDVRTWMAEVLADSVIRRVCKFARGQQEHGGNFLTKELNIVSMIQEENDDSFWYFERFKHDVRTMLARMERKEKR